MHTYHTYIRSYIRARVVCVRIYNQRKVGWWAFIRKWKRKENKRETKHKFPNMPHLQLFRNFHDSWMKSRISRIYKRYGVEDVTRSRSSIRILSLLCSRWAVNRNITVCLSTIRSVKKSYLIRIVEQGALCIVIIPIIIIIISLCGTSATRPLARVNDKTKDFRISLSWLRLLLGATHESVPLSLSLSLFYS